MSLAKAAGVYRIRHVPTGRSYVGQAGNIRGRWARHRHGLRAGVHHSTFLQRMWDKYGENEFAFEILLVCRVQDLDFYEQRALDVLKPEFNTAKVAGSTRGVKPSPESIEKNRLAQLGKKRSPETCERIRQAKLGKKATPEHRAAVSRGRMGIRPSAETTEKNRQAQLGRSASPETRKKISIANSGKKRTPETIERMRIAATGRTASEETREKMRVAQTGRKHSEETRRQMSESAKRYRKGVRDNAS